MRIAVTGRTGQVASALKECAAAKGHELVALARPQLDLARPDTIARCLDKARADVIVSAAAYTAVDQAESDREAAFAVNAVGAGALAEASARLGVPIVHLSTDYVFDGSLHRPYRESDAPAPTGVYGASKLAGEQAVLAANGNAAVVRVAWVYSPFGRNFVRTMLNLAREHETIRVVADQVGNPTSAFDIANGLVQVAEHLQTSVDPACRGLFHMTAQGEASWADFAQAIMACSAASGGPCAQIVPIPGAEYPTPARRPANSRLDCSRIEQVHGVVLPDWREALGRVVERLQSVPT